MTPHLFLISLIDWLMARINVILAIFALSTYFGDALQLLPAKSINSAIISKKVRIVSAMASLSFVVLSSPSFADDSGQKPEEFITSCSKTAKNCVSRLVVATLLVLRRSLYEELTNPLPPHSHPWCSRNIKDISMYSPPWTYSSSSEEAFDNLKAALSKDEKVHITLSEPPSRISVDVDRQFPRQDEVKFSVLQDDKVITFVSKEKDDGALLPDFGFQKTRLGQIRESAGFSEMGSSIGSSDTAGKRESFKTQLKSFYGLQSGSGWEDVLEKVELR